MHRSKESPLGPLSGKARGAFRWRPASLSALYAPAFACVFLFFGHTGAAGQDTVTSKAAESPLAILYKEVSKLCRAEDFEQARRLVSSVPEKELTSAQRWELGGLIETYAKEHKAAEFYFQKWCELVPDSPIARFNFAESLFLQKDFARAEIHFSTTEAVAGAAENPDVVELARYKRVLCLLADSKREGAGRLLQGFAWREESPAKSLLDASILFLDGKWVEAREVFAKCFALYPPEMNDLYVDSLLELGWVMQNESGQPHFKSGI